jgi:DNA-directed RNA polymerase sigma subunit (sigma70/sigma32)
MNEPMTFKQIGNELGVTEQRAKQICAGAINKLRRNFPATLELMMEMLEDRETMRHG